MNSNHSEVPVQGVPVHGVSVQTVSRRARGPPPLWEIRETDDMGFGLFAAQDIARGTRILTEAPIFILPDGEDPDDSREEKVMEMCEQLVRQGLFDGKLKQMEDLCYHLDIVEDKTIRDACREFLTDFARSLGLPQEGVEQNVERFATLYSIHMYNSWGQTENGFEMGIFPIFSRINHSCSPNAFHEYNKILKQLTVHALRDIKAGDQIFITYVDAAGYPSDMRDQKLEPSFIDCHCAICSNPATDDLQCELYQCYYGAWFYLHPEQLDTELVDMEVRVANDAHEAINFLKRTEQLLKAPSLDLQSEMLRVVYDMMAHCWDKLGQMDQAVEYAGKRVELSIVMGGLDGNYVQPADDFFKLLRQKREDLQP